jgi:uncharacterized protein DUF5670
VFLLLGLVLLVIWALAAFVLAVSGGLIHLLLVFAVLSLLWHLLSNRKTP